MTITVFTSNQPRHISLIESLASIADRVYAIQECNTIYPGQVDDFFRKSPVMQDYFSRVLKAENEIFGRPRLLPQNVQSLAIKMGDVSRIRLENFGDALGADEFVVFGASFIKGPLCDWLVEHQALNIHMGVSPYYRGSSTNFWAMYDRRPDLVGATIHRLSKGLDSGPMLFHALPRARPFDPFLFGMQAVRAAHLGVIEYLKTPQHSDITPVFQDRALELRYTRNCDFTDEVACNYLQRLISPQQMENELGRRDLSIFLRPYMI